MSEKAHKNESLTYELTAFNFAEESSNRIHSDDMAKAYGFTGGLVPGIAIYAYMTYPVVKHLGTDWLQRGAISVKFIKPLYTGDRVHVEAKRKAADADELEILVSNADGTTCAVGAAGIDPTGIEAPGISDYPRRTLPGADQRIEALAVRLPAGTPLGTLDFHLNPEELESIVRNDYLDNLEKYSAPDAVYHPAYLLEQANQIIMHSIDLGPWIHTRSEVQNFASPPAGEKLNIRGSVIRAYEKQGNEIAEFDLAIFDSKNRALMKVHHTAIIRLKAP